MKSTELADSDLIEAKHAFIGRTRRGSLRVKRATTAAIPEHDQTKLWRKIAKVHLELSGDHGAFLREALLPLGARLAVSHADDVHDRALLFARVAVAHRVVTRREDGSLLHVDTAAGGIFG